MRPCLILSLRGFALTRISDPGVKKALELGPVFATLMIVATVGQLLVSCVWRRIIRSVMCERRDQCVVMPTGYGKSLCYQFQPVFQVSS
jgi:hypothetical protein